MLHFRPGAIAPNATPAMPQQLPQKQNGGRSAAEIALEIAWNTGDVLPGERPRVEPYKTRDGTTRYGIRVN